MKGNEGKNVRFLIVTFAPIIYKEGWPYAYGPYAKEMDLWMDNADEVMYVCPEWQQEDDLLVAPFKSKKPFIHRHIPSFDFTSPKNAFRAIFKLPKTFWVIFNAMRWANHIHLRMPCNVGMVSCIAQIFFPGKVKTAKYAGNWDWNSKQPWTYRFQQRVLRNTFLTRNMKVLVYGSWPDKNRNILPFFTASYSEKEIEDTPPRSLNGPIKILYVGAFMPSKGPLTTIKVCEALVSKGYDVHLDMYGDGSERAGCEAYVNEKQLGANVIIHGNKPAAEVKKAFQQTHFLVFISRSEGWPKVVAETMFWGAVPITTAVSCVPEMLGNGQRGTLVKNDPEEIIAAIDHYLQHPDAYTKAATAGMQWSRQFTLERFENEIKQLLNGTHPSLTDR